MQNYEQCNLRVGDIVHLNSGSPELIVVAIDSKHAKVEWIDGHLTLQQVFPCACLKHSRKEDPRPVAAPQQ